ncbi:DUF4956 domain-containing protein [Anaerovorax odorimutans]|uniref:DUF4956 domain-containing protein n=1 Tax=Anaerovorax odorimutans TaxID=109327 RepID=A0ABT1RRV0_9FIRM|nr:DUF4956 domain-containing protein [Anaerovorax odorimutans]MCQ4637919.1 DUF4956 domain-containing protein [Anaerovorax odorimutans]
MNTILNTFNAQGAGSSHTLASSDLMISLLAAMILAAIMFITYRLCHDTLTYNKKFNITLLMISFISTVLLALVQGNPILSLGVLGSLSICRIRTNTKDPRDIGFVFWALAIGISSAVGAFLTGLCSTILLGSILILFNRRVKNRKALTMVVRGSKNQVGRVQEVFRETKGSSIQCKNVFADSFELVYELKMPCREEQQLLSLLSGMEGVHDVNVLAPQSKVA